jgi:hypothetical protein
MAVIRMNAIAGRTQTILTDAHRRIILQAAGKIMNAILRAVLSAIRISAEVRAGSTMKIPAGNSGLSIQTE